MPSSPEGGVSSLGVTGSIGSVGKDGGMRRGPVHGVWSMGTDGIVGARAARASRFGLIIRLELDRKRNFEFPSLALGNVI